MGQMAEPGTSRFAALLAAFVLTACNTSSTSPHPTAIAAASPTPLRTVSPYADTPAPMAVTCTAPPAAGEKLALVALHGTGEVVVRDLSDVAHPATRCTFSGGWLYRFISATRLSYVAERWQNYQGMPGALYVVDLTEQTTSLLRAWENSGAYSHVYAWSPDGTMLTYLSDDNQGAQNSIQWHVLTTSGDRTFATLSTGGNRCYATFESPSNTFLGFSPDGRYVAFVRPPWAYNSDIVDSIPFQVRRVSDGKLVYSRSDVTVPFWLGSGAHLYFQNRNPQQNTLEVWDPSGHIQTLTFAQPFTLLNPVPSPDGAHIVYGDYASNQSASTVTPWILDMSSTPGSFRKLADKPGLGASFLTPTLVWFADGSPGGLCNDPKNGYIYCLLYTSPSPRDLSTSRMPSSA